MNVSFLMLYLFAAFVVAMVMVITYLEKEKISKQAILVMAFALICIVAYSVNFMTDDYFIMSFATSIMMASQDFLLVSMLVYIFAFTRIENTFTTQTVIISVALSAVDSVMFIINAFNEVVLQYSLNMCGGVYVLGYEGNLWFFIHAMLNCIMLSISIGTLVIKCMRIPKAYWQRYIFMIAGFIFIVAIKYIFVSKVFDLRFDISILLYSLFVVLLYWNTFWYSKKTMLNITHGMIIDHMQIPVILFDYEGVIADFNISMKELFEVLELDKREQTLDWFVKEMKVPLEDYKSGGTISFSWNCKGKDYDCRLVTLEDGRKRLLGSIIVMNDVSELKQAYSDLEYSITYDALTGLFNKNSFMKKAGEYEDSSKWPVAVVSLNINRLSYINDNYGISEGDKVVVGLANLLMKKFDKRGFISRFSENDMLVVFQKMSEEKAISLMNDFVKEAGKQLSCSKYPVTVEYGVYIKNDDKDSLVNAANSAITYMRNKKMMRGDSYKSSLIDSLTQSLAENDLETEERVKRTKSLAKKFGEKLHLSDAEMSQLMMLVVLHDIGKIAIPETILSKPDKLYGEEWEIMKSHTEKGYRIAKAAVELEPIADCILSHHEKWDGSGYPNGLKGEEIPLLSRILTIVDAYDAMTHDRPYNKAVSGREALDELVRCAGTQFDPELVRVFVSLRKGD